jgi:hypothetical protein
VTGFVCCGLRFPRVAPPLVLGFPLQPSCHVAIFLRRWVRFLLKSAAARAVFRLTRARVWHRRRFSVYTPALGCAGHPRRAAAFGAVFVPNRAALFRCSSPGARTASPVLSRNCAVGVLVFPATAAAIRVRLSSACGRVRRSRCLQPRAVFLTEVSAIFHGQQHRR